jgi:alkaline phosphatase D
MPNPRLSRRTFVLGGAAAVGGAVLLGAPRLAGAAAEPPIRYPFTLGVASGDPNAGSVVLWTRLAPAPLNDDGLGGMPSFDYPVQVEVAKDEKFATVIASGTFTAKPADAHSLRVIVGGLPSNAWYFYRFKVQGHISPVGRTRTAPSMMDTVSSMKFSFASCQHWESGWYHAHRFLAADNPDLVLWLGDYMYEGHSRGARVREYTLDTVSTLAGYRQRYAQHRTDPNLQAAHAAAPWAVIFDDHEVVNNWAGKDEVTTPAARKAAAFQAWWENMPTRLPKPTSANMRAYRRLQWGQLAKFAVLDTRQYRDDHAPAGDCATIRATNRSLTGVKQENWLLNELGVPSARWNLLAQQVFFAQRDLDGDLANCADLSTDSWDGYQASRRRVTQGWLNSRVRNAVVLTGDVHRNWANDVHLDYTNPGEPVGSELVTSSISSDGDNGWKIPDTTKQPHLKFIGGQRGYVRCRLGTDKLVSEWVAVSSVTERNPAAVTASVVAKYVVEEGRPGIQKP